MPKPYFTLNLDVFGKPCLIIGGDGEALEKAERLVEAQAELTVVARRVIPELSELSKKHSVKLELREARPEDIAGKFLVLNCVKTEPSLSRWVYEESLRCHALISTYDKPEMSNVAMQALVRAGRVRIAISSGGSSPALTSALRKSFETIFDESFSDFTNWVAAEREKLIAEGVTPKERKEHFREFLKEFKIRGEINYPQAYLKKKN